MQNNQFFKLKLSTWLSAWLRLSSETKACGYRQRESTEQGCQQGICLCQGK